MNETILVPCRLMDMQFDESFVPPTPVPQLEKTSGMGLPNGGAFGPPSSGWIFFRDFFKIFFGIFFRNVFDKF